MAAESLRLLRRDRIDQDSTSMAGSGSPGFTSPGCLRISATTWSRLPDGSNAGAALMGAPLSLVWPADLMKTLITLG